MQFYMTKASPTAILGETVLACSYCLFSIHHMTYSGWTKEIKHFLQEGMSRNGSLLAKFFGVCPSRYLLAWRILCYLINGHDFHVGCCSHVLQDSNQSGTDEMIIGLRYESTGVSKSFQPSQFLSGDMVPLAPQLFLFFLRGGVMGVTVGRA